MGHTTTRPSAALCAATGSGKTATPSPLAAACTRASALTLSHAGRSVSPCWVKALSNTARAVLPRSRTSSGCPASCSSVSSPSPASAPSGAITAHSLSSPSGSPCNSGTGTPFSSSARSSLLSQSASASVRPLATCTCNVMSGYCAANAFASVGSSVLPSVTVAPTRTVPWASQPCSSRSIRSKVSSR